jgi:hypothetical protein
LYVHYVSSRSIEIDYTMCLSIVIQDRFRITVSVRPSRRSAVRHLAISIAPAGA